MYEIAGGFIHDFFNYADPTMMKRTKPVKKVENETNKQRRRLLLQDKMFELKRSEFNLSNKEWRWNFNIA